MSKVIGIEGLVKPWIITLGGYVASKAPDALEGKIEVAAKDVIKLDANENPYGCSPRVQRALAEFSSINIYPDAEQVELRRMLSEYVGARPECIVAGNGSDELIGYVMRSFVGPGDEVVNCVPTFDIFRHRTQLCGGTLVEVPRSEDYMVDVAAVKAAITPRTRLIPLATPNNPTGTKIPLEDILEIVETGVPVLVDEAYVEFNGETVVPLASKYDNMMVLRTFSKWAGLAGMRIGYGIFPPQIADYIMKIKEPYNVNIAAQIAVRESLKDLEYLRNNVKTIVAERDRLFAELSQLSFLKPYPSWANFVFCSVLKGNASEIQQRLERKGILIRYFDIPLLQNALRFGVGKPEHTDVMIRVLKQVEKELDDR
jgi:histidinol-phosphate aminotransferase